MLSGHHPKAIGLDIILPEPDRTSLKSIQAQFLTDFDIKLGFSGVPASLADNDAFLAHMFKKNDLVCARYFFFDHYNRESACKGNPFTVTDKTGQLLLHEATGVLCNTFQLEKSIQFTGFVNNQYDDDGLMRKSPLLISFQGEIFPHLSLSTFLKTSNMQKIDVLKDRYGLYIAADKYKIPITKKGYVNLRFNGPSGIYNYISAVDILNQSYSPSDVENKIIFIGSSAIGLGDIHQTVFDTKFPGVETHAVIMDNILQKQQVIIPIWADHFISFACLLTGILMLIMLIRSTGPFTFLGITFAWICLLVVSSLLVFQKTAVFISPGVPVSMAIVQLGMVSFLRFAYARRASFIWLKKLVSSQQLTMNALVSLVETRDPETGMHIQRTQHYARLLAQHLKATRQFGDTLNDTYIEQLFLSVPLHDIGKVGIPDRILLKPGKLTDEEFVLMKQHAAFGKDSMERAASKSKGKNYLQLGAEIAGSHHERWDGKGYPDGLSKETIPLSGRIMSICDVYDALINERCYKPAFSHEKAMEIIREEKGTLFDPVIVDAFFEIESEIKAVVLMFNDKSIQQQ